MHTVNIFGKHGAVGFVPPLLQRIWPVTIIKLDDDDEPIRDEKTGFVIRAEVNEPGEIIGKIVEGTPHREYKGYVGIHSHMI